MLKVFALLLITFIGPPVKEASAGMIRTITGSEATPQDLLAKHSGDVFHSATGGVAVRMPGGIGETELVYHFVSDSGDIILFPFGSGIFRVGDAASENDYNGGFLILHGPGRISVYGVNDVWRVETYGTVITFGSNYSASRVTYYRGGAESSLLKTLWTSGKMMDVAGAASAPTAVASGMRFAAGATNDIYFQLVMPSDWAEGTDPKLFLHYLKTSSASGTVKWQARWRVADYTGYDLSSWSSFVDFDTTINSDANTADRQAIVSFPAIDLSRVGGSPVYSRMIDVNIQRLSSGGSADTYAAAAVLVGVELHYYSETRGWRTSFAK